MKEYDSLKVQKKYWNAGKNTLDFLIGQASPINAINGLKSFFCTWLNQELFKKIFFKI